MRSRLDISISVGTFDLIKCGPAAEEGQALHEPHPALFYRCVLDAGEAAICRTPFSRERAEHHRTAHINGMLATSHPCRTRSAAASGLSSAILIVNECRSVTMIVDVITACFSAMLNWPQRFTSPTVAGEG
jgi:hypothetical protein